jgi:hypothetical protein
MDASGPCYDPFWVKPVSIFGLLLLTAFIESSHMFTLPSPLAPSRLMLAGPSLPCGSGGTLSGVATLSEGFQQCVTLLLYLVGDC